MNSSQARVPPSLAEFGWVGVVESARGSRGSLSSPSSRPPGERSPWSPTHSHTECRPELFDWPRSLENFRSGPPASVPQMVDTEPTGFARGATRGARSRTVCPARFQSSPRGARVGRLPQVFISSACSKCLSRVLVPRTSLSTLPPSPSPPSPWPRWPTRDELRGLARCEMGIEGRPEPNDVLQEPAGQAAGPGRVDREKGLGPVTARAKCKSGSK